MWRSAASLRSWEAAPSAGLAGRCRPETAIDMSGFSGISLYEPEELVLEAGAGTPLSEIEKALAKNHQQLAFEPPDYSQLLGGKHRARSAA